MKSQQKMLFVGHFERGRKKKQLFDEKFVKDHIGSTFSLSQNMHDEFYAVSQNLMIVR